jgi:hypothetical protein
MARRTRREQPVHPGLVLLGMLGVVGLTSSATLRLVLLAALATVAGGLLYAAAVLAVLWVLALFLPDPVVVLIAVVGTIAGLPFVGPLVFRLTTGRAPDEQPGGLVPPLPRRLREPRRRASLVSGRRARKDVRS